MYYARNDASHSSPINVIIWSTSTSIPYSTLRICTYSYLEYLHKFFLIRILVESLEYVQKKIANKNYSILDDNTYL